MNITSNTLSILTLLDEAYKLRTSNLTESIEYTEKALLKSQEINNPELIAKSYSKLSLYYMIIGNFAKSVELANNAIRYFETVEDKLNLADAKYNIASVYYKTDNYHLGLINLIDCLQIYKQANDHHNIGRVYKSLGTIYEFFGYEVKATEAYMATIEHAKLVGDKNLESNAYNPLSGIYLKKGDLDQAMKLAQSAIDIKNETGDIRGFAFAIYALAKVQTALGQFEKAEKNYLESYSIHQNFNELLGTAMTLRKLGELYFISKQYDKALETLLKARDFSYKNHIAIIKYKSNYHLYQLYKEMLQPEKALAFLEEHLSQKDLVVKNQTLTIIDNFELLNKVESIKRESEIQKERAEILEKKIRAENLSNMKQDFLSTMSHEIRTPLNAVMTIANLLGNNIKNEEEKDLVQSLKQASNNLFLLINDILDFTKLESGKIKLDKAPYKLLSVVENLYSTYHVIANEKGLKLSFIHELNENDLYEFDNTRVSQILVNLLANAIKYTERGKITLEIRTINRKQESDIMRFSVTDTGIGIPVEEQKLIFDRFAQVKEVRTRKYGGSGLGLAIIKKLIDLHQSEINLISSPNNGSTFYFDIELTKVLKIIEPFSLTNNPLKDKHILLVEDNPINALVAKKLLAKWELTTKHQINGIMGIEMAALEKFDLILMDIHMPEMDGFEAAKWIRTHENPNKETPIIALTADITAEFNQDYQGYFDFFLRKPIEMDKLLEKLKLFIK
ncbi:MAG: ATP-binding protein [bacterium]|nr:ATP-binding protein [bacterium]